MTINKEKSVAFTGYRTAKIFKSSSSPNIIGEIFNKLEISIISLYEQGYNTFITGMSEGFDMIAAEVVLNLKSKNSGIKLIAAIPYANQNSEYSKSDKNRYDNILSYCDEVFYISENYQDRVFLDRNDFMINNSMALICYYDGQRGGTMYTYNRAVAKDLHITNICSRPLKKG